MLIRENLINEKLIDDGHSQSGNNHAQSDNQDEKHSPLILQEFFGDDFYDVVAVPRRLEIFFRNDFEANAGIRGDEVIEGNFAATECRVIEVGDAVFDTFEHDEVIKLPMNNQRINIAHDDFLSRPRVSFCLTTERPSRLQDISGIGAVAIDAAHLPQLFKRYPKFVVRQNHSQRRCAAFGNLQSRNLAILQSNSSSAPQKLAELIKNAFNRRRP